MGDKIAAKAAAREAGLPVLEGSDGPVSDVEAALAAADRAGFPILLKAAAGGGGKGMRRVERPGDLAQAFEVAQREAEAAFSDGGLYVERLLEGARHVEIQVMADGQGGVLVCGDRECSIQRRHQKLIEEALGAAPAGRDPRGDAAGGPAGLQGVGLPQRRHAGVPGRRRGRLLLPRAERAPAGGAPGHRARHRPRPRGRAAPRRRGRAPVADRRRRGARPRHRVPHQRGGPLARLPARRRAPRRLPHRPGPRHPRGHPLRAGRDRARPTTTACSASSASGRPTARARSRGCAGRWPRPRSPASPPPCRCCATSPTTRRSWRAATPRPTSPSASAFLPSLRVDRAA